MRLCGRTRLRSSFVSRDRGFCVEVGCLWSLLFVFLRVLIWTLPFVLLSSRSCALDLFIPMPLSYFQRWLVVTPCALYPHDCFEERAIDLMLSSPFTTVQPTLFSMTLFSLISLVITSICQSSKQRWQHISFCNPNWEEGTWSEARVGERMISR